MSAFLLPFAASIGDRLVAQSASLGVRGNHPTFTDADFSGSSIPLNTIQHVGSPRGVADLASLFSQLDSATLPMTSTATCCAVEAEVCSSFSKQSTTETASLSSTPHDCDTPQSAATATIQASPASDGHTTTPYSVTADPKRRRLELRLRRAAKKYDSRGPAKLEKTVPAGVKEGALPVDPVDIASVSKIIRNRGSVQRCRQRKRLYIEILEQERELLRVENAALSQALWKLQQWEEGAALLMNFGSNMHGEGA